MIVLLIGVVQVGLRTDAFVRPALEPRLEALAQRWNGRLVVERIEPHGLVGVQLHGVEFRPHRWAPERDVPLVRVDRVVVRPDLGALFRGELRPEHVRLDTPRVTALLDSNGGPLDAWLDWLARDIRRDPAAEAHDAEPEPGARAAALLARLPSLDVRGGFITVDDRAGRYPSAGVRLASITFDPTTQRLAGEMRIEGLGRAALTRTPGEDRISLQLLDARDVRGVLPSTVPADADAAMSVDELTVSWPPRVTVYDVAMHGLAVRVPGPSGAWVRSIAASELSLGLDAWGLSVTARDVGVDVEEADTPISVRAAQLSVAHAWDGLETRAEGTLLDAAGQTLSFAFDRRDGGDRVVASVDGDDVELARLANLLPLPIDIALGDGVVGLHADLTWDGDRGVATGRFDASCRDLTFDAPLIATDPVRGLAGSLGGSYEYDPGATRFELSGLRGDLPDLGLLVRGDGTLGPDRFRLDARATIPPRPAQELLRALPAGFAPTLQGMRANGDMGLELVLQLDTNAPTRAITYFDLQADGFEVEQFGPLAPIADLLRNDFALTVTTYEGRRRRLGPGVEGWTPLVDLPPHVYRAVLAAEDDGFFRHEGFDTRGIARAVEINLTERRLARGGSTITQQVVKNLFLGHERTVSRKLQEAFLTWQIEATVPKPRILELYLNLAHWGPGIYGIRDAAQAYFGRDVGELTVREAAFLAAILPSPNRYAAAYVEGHVEASRWVKMGHILDNMERGGFLGPVAAATERSALRRGAISRTPPPRRLGEHLPLLPEAVDVTLEVHTEP